MGVIQFKLSHNSNNNLRLL